MAPIPICCTNSRSTANTDSWGLARRFVRPMARKTAIGSLLPDSSSSNGVSFPERLSFLAPSTRSCRCPGRPAGQEYQVYWTLSRQGCSKEAALRRQAAAHQNAYDCPPSAVYAERCLFQNVAPAYDAPRFYASSTSLTSARKILAELPLLH